MSAPDLDAIEARARRDVVTCDECDAPATRVCNASECGATRCDAHAAAFSGYRGHRWYPRRSLAAEVLALVALAREQAAQIATLRAAYAQDLDGLRAELRRADDERATWRDLRDAARAYLEARDGWQLSRVLGSTAARVTLDALDAARTRLAALVGGAS